jgi:hypothetical protein
VIHSYFYYLWVVQSESGGQEDAFSADLYFPLIKDTAFSGVVRIGRDNGEGRVSGTAPRAWLIKRHTQVHANFGLSGFVVTQLCNEK